MPASRGHFQLRATMPSMMNSALSTLAALALAAAALPVCAQEPQMNLPRVTLSAGMYQIDAQVAQTHEQRRSA